MWPFRDWVVRAFNSNMPFDQFTVEQLAGDLLPDATMMQRIATGFHRNAMQAKGNNPRKEEFRVRGVVDRVNTTGRTWLGLTLECAECHQHKYDPITQREYYQLYAVFNNTPHLGQGYGVHGPMAPYIDPVLAQQQAALESALARLPKPSIPKPSASQENLVGHWRSIEHPITPPADTTHDITGALTILATISTKQAVGDIVSKYDWHAGQRAYVFGIGGQREKNATPGHLYAWVSSSAAKWQGTEIYSSRPVNDGQAHQVAFVFEPGKLVRLYLDGAHDEKARIFGTPPAGIAKSARPLAIGGGYGKGGKPEDFRFGGNLPDVQLFSRVLSAEEIQSTYEAGLPREQRNSIARATELRREIAQISSTAIQANVMEELLHPRATFIHIRGDFKNRGEPVQPGTPAALPPLDGPVDRLALARWLARPDHPLTARVFVNRLWERFFGTGLVASSADFGFQGDYPSHPELLDWLAAEFVASGWDVKHMVKLIVTSATYRQSSNFRADDPDKRLFARASRFRLPAEQIRDCALAAAGLLDRKIGGRPVFPPQPAGFYEERGQTLPGNSNFKWVESKGRDRHRRTLYTYWKRMALHPSLAAFDAPPRQICTVKRSITNTPQQALVALNDPMFVEAARALAEIALKEPTEEKRIALMFQRCLSRDPDQDEIAAYAKFLSREGDNLTIWTSAASALMNTDEFFTRE